MTAITKWDGILLPSIDVPVFEEAFAAAVNATAKYARNSAQRAGDAALYLRQVRDLDAFDVSPAVVLRAAIATLDCARSDLEAALTSITTHNIAAE